LRGETPRRSSRRPATVSLSRRRPRRRCSVSQKGAPQLAAASRPQETARRTRSLSGRRFMRGQPSCSTINSCSLGGSSSRPRCPPPSGRRRGHNPIRPPPRAPPRHWSRAGCGPRGRLRAPGVLAALPAA
jgi:hypothetical protein